MAYLPLHLFLARSVGEPLLEEAILQLLSEHQQILLELDLVLDASVSKVPVDIGLIQLR